VKKSRAVFRGRKASNLASYHVTVEGRIEPDAAMPSTIEPVLHHRDVFGGTVTCNAGPLCGDKTAPVRWAALETQGRHLQGGDDLESDGRGGTIFRIFGQCCKTDRVMATFTEPVGPIAVSGHMETS